VGSGSTALTPLLRGKHGASAPAWRVQAGPGVAPPLAPRRTARGGYQLAPLIALFCGTIALHPATAHSAPPDPPAHSAIRVATFNVSLHRTSAGELVRDLEAGVDPQAQKAAEILQLVRPQVLLLNEVDYDPPGRAVQLLQRKYLEISQGGQPPLHYAHQFLAPVNTGLPSGFDLDQNGSKEHPADAFGFGAYPGQFGLIVLSQLPIDQARARTFQQFLWKDMPGALQPRDPQTLQPFYEPHVWRALRLSSKSHWDVPLHAGKCTIHFLVSHPTPPVFDGPEDRNGCRNHDEIRFWADYVDPGRSGYIYDDRGQRGGLPAGAQFLIAGDLNADPRDGSSREQAVRQLLDHPLIHAQPVPRSEGAVEQAAHQGGANLTQRGDPAHDTADFADATIGNLRVDYVLTSRTLRPLAAGVFWPRADSSAAALLDCSDHRLVWLDIAP
jgi:hypothetical protein